MSLDFDESIGAGIVGRIADLLGKGVKGRIMDVEIENGHRKACTDQKEGKTVELVTPKGDPSDDEEPAYIQPEENTLPGISIDKGPGIQTPKKGPKGHEGEKPTEEIRPAKNIREMPGDGEHEDPVSELSHDVGPEQKEEGG